MYTKRKYSVKDMIKWTRREILTYTLYTIGVVLLYDVVGFHWLRVPWTPIALIGTVVAFLIAFQNNAAYGRIWEARKIWGAIVNDSRTWAMMVKDMVTNEHADQPVDDSTLYEQKKTLIYRHIAWLTALRYSMRQPKPWETFLRYKTNREWYKMLSIPERDIDIRDAMKDLMSDDEFKQVMKKTNKAAAILWLQSKHIRQLKEQGYIWEFSFLELESVLGRLFEHQGKSERIKNFPYPRQFATLGFDFVKVFAFILPFGIIPEFSKIGDSLIDQYPIISPYFVWASVPFSAMVAWVFDTMQRIGVTGENPFEGSANDVPISAISRGIEIDLREMLEEDKAKIPEPFEVIYGVQM
jgi:putative membrane protein